MKNSRIYDILRARYLVNEDAFKNWRFILYVLLLAMLMIANTHNYERKSFEILALNNEVKELRSVFVDRRSELMKLKMESTITMKMEGKGILPSETPPVKIRVKSQKPKNWFQKIWN
ncbi:MAG: FtsL-like putative cell division protein [Flavobacterium sp.]